MIALPEKTAANRPVVLHTKGRKESLALMEKYNKGERSFSFKSDIYGCAEVKDRLKELQSNKCCFCEARIIHISYGDVEHFRPKAGYCNHEKDKIHQPGYYWLAYDWDNLLLSCTLCNQRFKKNFFPLSSRFRARHHGLDHKKEKPVFINPYQEDPAGFISFNNDLPIAVRGNERGKLTIQMLGLDREALNEDRRERLNDLKDLMKLALGYPETYPALRARAIQNLKTQLREKTDPQYPYSAMFRSFFKQNPIPEN